MTVHLSVNSMALDLAVQVGRVHRVGHIAVAMARVALSVSRDGVGRVSRSGMGIGGMGGSDAGIVAVVVTVSVSWVVGSVVGSMVGGSVVGSVVGGSVVGSVVGGSVVGSVVSRSSVGVGGGGDHGLTGSSTHVHLLAMTHAPLVLGTSIS